MGIVKAWAVVTHIHSSNLILDIMSNIKCVSKYPRLELNAKRLTTHQHQLPYTINHCPTCSNYVQLGKSFGKSVGSPSYPGGWGDLACVHADLDAPTVSVLLGATSHVDVVLAIVLALVEDVVDVVGDHGALDAEVVVAVGGAQVDGGVVRAADALALVRRAHITVGASATQILLALNEVLPCLLPVDIVRVLADDLAIAAALEGALADAEGLWLDC